MGFRNPIAALSGALSFPSIHSPGFISGQTGWSINRDGTAEFNALGGSLQITASGIFFYIPTPGTGNLRASLTNADGTDPYGNTYKAGWFVNQRQIWASSDLGHTVVINPTSTTGPQLLFTPSGLNALMHILVEGGNNRMLIEDTNNSNAFLEVNTGFIVTDGVQGVNTAQGAQPPFNVTGSFVDYLNASWAALSFKCPKSETIQIITTVYGHNSNTAASTLSVSPRLKNGAATLMAPSQGVNGVVISPEGDAAGATGDHFKSMVYTVGQDILGGLAGTTLTVVPAWRISSGSAATANISNASMTVMPQAFTSLQSG